jgi:membrane protein YqaA with SNARE-associated domain
LIKEKLTQKGKAIVTSKHMLSGITLASFLESTIIPIPLEALLIPLMQSQRSKLWAIAFMATLGCIAGALFGYALGYFLFDALGEWVIHTFSSPEQFALVKEKMQQQGFWFVLTLGIVPIPFQLAMLAAGATKYSIWLFLLATIIARSIRYFGLALVVKLAGNQAERLIRRFRLSAIGIGLLLVLLLWWLLN